MNTIPLQVTDGRRRLHSDQFKANAVAACMQPGISMAAVAMAHGVNANLLRRWVNAAEVSPGKSAGKTPALTATRPPTSFVPLQLPTRTAAAEIRIELRRGATVVSVSWPSDAAADCAAWMRELLR